MTISEDERNMRMVLEHIAEHGAQLLPACDARTILALLDASRMPRPEDVPDEAVRDMVLAWCSTSGSDENCIRAAYRVLYDALTQQKPKPKPKPKPAEAWAVVWPGGTVENVVTTREAANQLATMLAQPGRIVHLREVESEHD